ncbi:MAG: hypothetical protein CBD78_00045 [Candidatus Thioglobus sp. TMED218]|nr:MAG: hypothetical protein CBD78_00045 [Candidatus Thioglobus sp. TMED218]|tara:strand:- start:2206 stop:4023 length:1818 start_codon:yes stop_codon:yes gene_type:complete
MVATTLQQLVDNAYAEKSYLVELGPYNLSTSAVVNLYFSDRGFVTSPSESPANTLYDSRVMEALNFQRSMFQEGRIGGRSVPGFGEIVLNNADGGLDALAGYAWDSRSVTIKVGEVGANLSQHFTIFQGVSKSVEFDDMTLKIIIHDDQDFFTRTIPSVVYAGTGGAEGSDVLKGTPKPLVFGEVTNIAPILVDPTNNIYQINDGQIEAISNVYIDGVRTTSFTADLNNGRLTMSSTPTGIVTCDAKGSKPSGSYKSTVGDVVRYIGSQFGGLSDPADYDTASFTALNTANSTPVGIYLTGFTEIGAVLDELINSIGAFYGFGRDGKFSVGRLELASGTADLEADSTNILEINHQPTVIPNYQVFLGYKYNFKVFTEEELGTLASPASTSYAVTVVNVSGTNYFALGGTQAPAIIAKAGDTLTFTQSDGTNSGHPLAIRTLQDESYTDGVTVTGTAGTSGAQTAFIIPASAPSVLRYYCTVHGNVMGNTITIANNRDYLLRSSATINAVVSGLQTKYPNSTILQINSYMVSSIAASSEVSRLATLYGTQRDVYRIRMKIQPFTLKINDVVKITFNRYDLTTGKLFRVVTISEDAAVNEVELEVWG